MPKARPMYLLPGGFQGRGSLQPAFSPSSRGDYAVKGACFSSTSGAHLGAGNDREKENYFFVRKNACGAWRMHR